MNQFGRKCILVLYTGAAGIDLSQFRIKFSVQAADNESPNNAWIRVYNLSSDTMHQVATHGEYTSVSLSAGYEEGNFGVIFQGTIKQYRIGKENTTDSYLDIFAADSDVEFNQTFINQTFSSGSTIQQQFEALSSQLGSQPLYMPDFSNKQYQPYLRSKVLFGMARSSMRMLSNTLGARWSIQNGTVTVTPQSGYIPGDPVEINVQTGLVGVPEQTDEGIKITCLLNSQIKIGGLVKLNNAEINQLFQANSTQAPIPYNRYVGRYVGIQNVAPTNADGTYCVYVHEFEGDTRGHPWFSHITCLSVKPSVSDPNQAVTVGQ